MAAAKKDGDSGKGLPEGNVDQIREILFGGQMRDYERRFQLLEERLAQDLERFRADQQQRLEGLEQLIRDESAALAGSLKRLEAEQRRQHSATGEQLKSQDESLRAELAELAGQVEEGTRQLRERLLKLSQESADALQRQAEQYTRQLGSSSAELRDAKVAREELAGLFSEVALRLKRDFELPGD